VLENVEISVI